MAGVRAWPEAPIFSLELRATERLPYSCGMPSIQTTMRFNQRFLDRHAGSIITDPVTALVELVANAWDASASKVKIKWPDQPSKRFSIEDDGTGMTKQDFEDCWSEIDYDRVSTKGRFVPQPESSSSTKLRQVYGQNGRGRHAAFHFGPSGYIVRTWRDGHENSFRVERDPLNILRYTHLGTKRRQGHGTEIHAVEYVPVRLSPQSARTVIGTRFLADPDFKVSIDGDVVDFEDIPTDKCDSEEFSLACGGEPIKIFVIDCGDPDRTTKQKGLAWRVNGRLVGDCNWEGPDGHKLLDGRSTYAKRYSVIILADVLHPCVRPDWSDFDRSSAFWKEHQQRLHDSIGAVLDRLIAARRSERGRRIRAQLNRQSQRMKPLSRERWSKFIDEVIAKCPSLGEKELIQLASILAELEISDSQYDLLGKVALMDSLSLDQLNEILREWRVGNMKIVLDRIHERLSLIYQLKQKIHLKTTHEVQELQPLIERSLWMFGPEFESIEYTANQGMTKVIRMVMAARGQSVDVPEGSTNRPDFVILPDSTVGFYGCPGAGPEGELVEAQRLVIVELKRPGIPIGKPQKDQAELYARELRTKGCLQHTRWIDAFVLGEDLDQEYTDISDHHLAHTRLRIKPMRYDTLIEGAERRMLNLYKMLDKTHFTTSQIHDFIGDTDDSPLLRYAGIGGINYPDEMAVAEDSERP